MFLLLCFLSNPTPKSGIRTRLQSTSCRMQWALFWPEIIRRTSVRYSLLLKFYSTHFQMCQDCHKPLSILNLTHQMKLLCYTFFHSKQNKQQLVKLYILSLFRNCTNWIMSCPRRRAIMFVVMPLQSRQPKHPLLLLVM